MGFGQEYHVSVISTLSTQAYHAEHEQESTSPTVCDKPVAIKRPAGADMLPVVSVGILPKPGQGVNKTRNTTQCVYDATANAEEEGHDKMNALYLQASPRLQTPTMHNLEVGHHLTATALHGACACQGHTSWSATTTK